LILTSNRVECTKEGVLLDPSAAIWAGDISKRRIANMLPINYVLTKKLKNEALNLANSIVPDTEPTATLLHEFVRDSLKIIVRFSQQIKMAGTLSVSIVEREDSSFIETEKSVVDTTTKVDNKSIQLGNVVVKGKRKITSKTGSVQYIRPDIVQSSDDFKDDATGNVLTRLQEKIPGIRIVEIIDDFGMPQYVINVRGSKQSSFLKYEPPLILMNGIPFTQNLNDLRAVSLKEVLCIEVFKSAHSLFGSRGSNGVINVITKSQAVISITDESKKNGYFTYNPNKAFDSIKGFKANFWIPEKGKKLTIVIIGKMIDGQTFYLEKNVVSM
jgi:outer membrane receptor for Fe3+-dicitrate